MKRSSCLSFATNDERTEKRVSDGLGVATEIRSQRDYAGHRLPPWLGHLMVLGQESARPLMTVGEVMQIPAREEIVMLAGCPPIAHGKHSISGIAASSSAFCRRRISRNCHGPCNLMTEVAALWRNLGGGLLADVDATRDVAGNGVSLQPLARIDDPAERAWAAEWVGHILAREGTALTPDAKALVWSALNSLASSPVHERTISGLAALLQSNALKQALAPYCLGGA